MEVPDAGVTIEPETVARLADIPNIVGVKDSSGKFELIQAYIEATKGKEFAVLSGNDALILDTLKAGGTGGITTISNILPEIMVSIYKKYKAGDEAGARQAQDSIAPIRACFQYGNPNSIVKVATNLIGHPVGPCRRPFGLVPEDAKQAIAQCIDTHYAQYKKM
ncbi:dihydrodipicolinate synthase family protein [Clostridiaceae bacterium]|nr:dihydrodipicolinate synthase family protein [Clostridiaceae bacterium]